SKDDKSSGIRSAKDDVAARLIKNTYKTLLTRGQKGCFIYCEDKVLADYIRSFLVSYVVTEPLSKVAERDRENRFF
ncbi:MAG: DNA/RNA helicase domain-containing protein, partial [Succiniclasticum sp.]|nr:DNA/RNA helicase domain-containing protein [Succiniclasticum sp.]